jgi:hypothetical protein
MTARTGAAPLRWPSLKEMLDSYFYLDPSSEEPLEDLLERVKADCPATEIGAIRADIADLLARDDPALDAAWVAELRSYYWPGGEGLSTRAWFTQIDRLLGTPPDTSRDHRTGAFGS